MLTVAAILLILSLLSNVIFFYALISIVTVQSQDQIIEKYFFWCSFVCKFLHLIFSFIYSVIFIYFIISWLMINCTLMASSKDLHVGFKAKDFMLHSLLLLTVTVCIQGKQVVAKLTKLFCTRQWRCHKNLYFYLARIAVFLSLK